MMHAKGIRRAPVLCTAGVCALAALAVAGTAGGSGADAASRPSSPDSGRARSGMVTVAGLAMVSRPSPACAAPACVPRPGREADGAPGGGWGALVDAEGSLFAAVALPPGARITRLVLRGFDGLPRNFGPHLGACLRAIRPTGPNPVTIGFVRTPGGGGPQTVTQGRFQPGPATVVKRDYGYYVEAFFPPVGAGQGPVALLSVSVGDQTARSAPAAASSRHGQRA